MRIVARKPFNDAHTGELHRAGDIIDVSEERFAEIAAVDPDLAVRIVDEEPETEEPETEEPEKGKSPRKRTTSKSVSK